MSQSSDTLRKVTLAVTELKRNIQRVERKEQEVKLELLRANPRVEEAKRKITQAEEGLRKAEQVVHQFNEVQKELADQKSRYTSDLVKLNKEAEEATRLVDEEKRKEREKNSPKK